MKPIHTQAIIFIFFFLMMGLVNLSAQSTDIPTLKKSLSEASSDTARIDICIQLINGYSSVNLDSSLYFFNTAVNLAEDISDTKRLGIAFSDCFYMYFDQAKYHEAKVIANKELEKGEKLKSDLLISKSYMLISNLYWELADFPEYFKAASKGLKYAEESGDINTIAKAYFSLSNFYADRGEKKKGDEHRRKALEMYEKTKDSINIGIVYYNVAFFFTNNEEYDSSLYYSNLSLSYLTDTNIPPYDFAMGRKVEALFFTGKEETGLELMEDALEHATQNQHKRSLIFLNLIKAKCLVQQKKYVAAITTGEKGVDISNEIGYEAFLSELTKILAECYKAKHDYKKSLYWSEEKIKIDEEFAKRERESEITKLEANFELQKKEAENQVLVLKNRIQKILLFTLASVGLIFIFWGYYFLKRKQRKQFSEFRQTVAADLHDDVGSNLNSIARMAKELKSQSSSLSISESIDLLVEKTNSSIKNVVDVIWSIDDEKLKLGQLIERMESHLDSIKVANPDMKINLIKKNLNEQKILTTKQKHHLLMVFKEAINNIQEHTNSSEIKIEIENFGNGIKLNVVNFFDSKKYAHDSTGRGLVNIRSRVMELDGEVEFQETKNKFEVNVELKNI